MSKKSNPAVIGGFVVGAIALVVAAILIFGGGAFFADTFKFVSYFTGSVTGLTVGAPVRFNGAQVGAVTKIRLEEHHATQPPALRVAVFMDARDVVDVVPPDADRGTDLEAIDDLVGQGMRAQLALQSLVTGQLYVSLNMLPDAPINRVGAHPDVYEVPTVQSDIERLAETVQKLPIGDLFEDVAKAAKGIEGLVNGPELEAMLQTLSETISDVQILVRHVDENRGRLAPQLETALQTFDNTLADVQSQVPVAGAALEQVKETFAMESGVPGALASDVRSTLKTARAALGQAEQTLASVEELTVAESPVNEEVMRTLREISAAARSIRILADFIQRHPEAFLAGKGGPGG